MKKIIILLFALILLIACQPTPETPIVVQKDTERLIDTVVNQNTTPDESIDPASADPGFVKFDKRYTYDYASDNGRLTIHADADVYLPARGAISMAYVLETGFSEAFMQKAFDKTYAGEQAYTFNPNAYVQSKKQIAEEIVYYQELIDTGRTDEEKMMDEDEARAHIEELKERYETAPDEPIDNGPLFLSGPQIKRTESDSSWLGQMIVEDLTTFSDSRQLDIQNCTSPKGLFYNSYLTYMRCGLNGDSPSWSSGYEGRSIDGWYEPYTEYRVSVAETDCAYGQSLSPAQAVALCTEYLGELGVTDVLPYRQCDLYLASANRQTKSLYFISFTRTAAGSPVAYVPTLQREAYNKYQIPWSYETILFGVDDSGILFFSWNDPISVTDVISTDVQTIPFEDAARIFESMSAITYEADAAIYDDPVYYDLCVDQVELSMMRIREQNSEIKMGLYVPVWVFYGKIVKQYNERKDVNADQYMEAIVLAINAVDGSVIDLSKGY